MAYDLLIKDARICDGTGAPVYSGAIGVEGRQNRRGRRRQAGRHGAKSTQRGLVLAPGFVDMHTHYDAQISWDRLLTCSSGTALRPADGQLRSRRRAGASARIHATMAWDLVNVEALPHDVLMNGVAWEWESFPEYMAAIERTWRRA